MKQLWRLHPFLGKYSLQILFALVSLLGITAAQLFFPMILKQVIDIGLSNGDVQFLFKSALLILGIGLITAILIFLQRYLSEWIAAHIGYDLRNQLYDNIQHLSFTYHDHAQTGQLISRCIEDVRSIERFTGFGVVELIHLILLFISIVIFLFTANARLAGISLLPLIPLVIMTTNLGSKIGGYFLQVNQMLGELSSRIQENITGVQVVRAFAREPYEVERFDSANRTLYSARLAVIGEWSKIMPTTHFLVTLSTILVLWFGGIMVLNGDMTIGEVVAFNSYLLLLALPARQLTWLVNLAGEAIAGVQRTYEILDMDPEIQSPSNALYLPSLAGQVTFQDVCFKYRGEKSHALKNIQLSIEPNQIVALIGATGSGKTSLVNLIPRFYEVTEGAVKIDGNDVRRVDLVSLRKQIGIVLQTSLLFSTTIRENIAYGIPDAEEAQIISAARAAQAHDFILDFPNGYDTTVGERGVTLSGGQRQRIAIARALLMNPRILILDDSTSSVDMQTERLIQQALENLMEGRTTFVIAHRLSTVRRADVILVMDHGHIVERGTHHQLLASNGLYNEIYNLQLKDQE
ncbi:MAG: ABC transporter ATP-binding protein [Anaerolineales bacterium]|nr:ABC transporter ATP-binding protein [Anaerolineales bacterium]